jgi:outer membrane lipoprotein-sorting protein
MRNLLLAGCLFVSGFHLKADSVDAILARMDQAAPDFKALSATVQMVTFTSVLGDKTVENGTLKMQRLKQNDVRAIIDFTGGSDARTIALLGKKVRIYYPNLQQYQDYDIGSNSQMLNQFLLLGFGSSGKELAQGYTITSEGSENVTGLPTTKLLLVPKDPKVKERLTKVEIWIPDNSATPVQQQFYEPSGNWRKVTYTDIDMHPAIQGTLELKLPSGTTKQSR